MLDDDEDYFENKIELKDRISYYLNMDKLDIIKLLLECQDRVIELLDLNKRLQSKL